MNLNLNFIIPYIIHVMVGSSVLGKLEYRVQFYISYSQTNTHNGQAEYQHGSEHYEYIREMQALPTGVSRTPPHTSVHNFREFV